MGEVYVARGERAGLTPVDRRFAAHYARWMNDVEVKAGVAAQGLYTPGAEEAWADECARAAAQREPTAVNFTIHDLADDAPVGVSGVFDISHRHRSAELGIALGERRGTGLGTDAVHLVLDWAFNVLSLYSVELSAIDYNDRAVRAYERAGFRRVGVRRGMFLARGRLRDGVVMDAIAPEFTDSVLTPRETDVS